MILPATTGNGTPRSVGTAGFGSPLAALVLFAVMHGLLWAVLIPPWQAPDEPKHFEYVRLIAERGEVVAFATEDEAADLELQRWILASMDRHHFWWYGRAPSYDPAHPPERFSEVWPGGSHTAFYRQSPAYYWLASRFQPADRLAGLYAARLVGVLLAALTVLLIGLAAAEIAPGDTVVRLGAPALAALQPMFMAQSAGVNNDTLANAAAAGVFWLAARLLARGMSLSRLALLAIAAVGAVAVKRTVWVAAPLAIAAVALRPMAAGRPVRHVVTGVLGVAALVAALGYGLWSAGAWQALPEAWRFGLSRYFFNEPDQAARILSYLQAQGIGPVLVDYLWSMHKSFWGSFGWQVVLLPTALHVATLVVAGVLYAGTLVRVFGAGTPPVQRAGLVVAGLAVVLAIAGALVFFVAYLDLAFPVPPQGRYVFVALGPMAILLAAGLSEWLGPARRRAGLRLWLGALATYDLVCLAGFVVPFFYR